MVNFPVVRRKKSIKLNSNDYEILWVSRVKRTCRRMVEAQQEKFYRTRISGLEELTNSINSEDQLLPCLFYSFYLEKEQNSVISATLKRHQPICTVGLLVYFIVLTGHLLVKQILHFTRNITNLAFCPSSMSSRHQRSCHHHHLHQLVCQWSQA